MTFDPHNPPKPLTIDKSGRLSGGGIKFTYNNPFPCVNGSFGSGAMDGVVMHTMVGNLPGTVTVFNDPNFQASAHFGIDQQGNVHQFGPIGKGWIAWHVVSGNSTWYGIENADNGNPDNPLTDEQMTSFALILEFLSRFAGFPLKEANSVTEKGLGVHYMGGAAWGGHTCPDLPPEHVRSHQRPEIIARAKAIRNPVPVPSKTTVTFSNGVVTSADGTVIATDAAGSFTF